MTVSSHGTLTAATVATVTLTYPAVCRIRALEVLNADGAADIYATIDGSEPATAGSGTNTHRLPAVIGSITWNVPINSVTSVVKLLSASTPQYSVVVE